MGRKRGAAGPIKAAKKSCPVEIKAEPTSDMAKSTNVTHLWHAEHSKDGLKLISDNERYHDLLINNSSALSKKLKLTDSLWTLLLQRGVIDEQIKEKIQAKKREQAQVLSLVNHLTDLEMYKLHGFIWAVVNTHQHDIAELLRFDVRYYFDMEIFMKYSNFRCPSCSEFYTKAYILTGCEHYVCDPCVKGAKFTCKEDGKEDVTCPVPECNKVTEASPSKGNIGLEEDIPFRDLCQVLVKEMAGVNCSDCNTLMSESPVKHLCSECDKFLCADCTTKHKKDERRHHILHHHLTDVCCVHGKDTTVYCKQCDTYCCDQCSKGLCGHDKKVKKTEKKFASKIAEQLNNKKHLAKLKQDVSSFLGYKFTLDVSEARVKAYVKMEEQKIREMTDAWAQENLVQYSNIQQQVGMRLKKSLQWQKAATELTAHVLTRPWLTDVGKNMEIILKENTDIISSDDMNLVSHLRSCYSIPKVMTPIPLITRPPENKDGSGAEMTCPFTVENISNFVTKQVSPPFIIRNLAWRIRVDPTPAVEGTEKSLGFYISIETKPGSSPQTCNAEVQYKLLNWKTDKEPHVIKTKVLFDTKQLGMGYHSFISWNKLMDPENGYVKDDYIRLEAHIKAEEPKEDK